MDPGELPRERDQPPRRGEPAGLCDPVGLHQPGVVQLQVIQWDQPKQQDEQVQPVE